MNYAYNNNFSNPYARNYGAPNYVQPQYQYQQPQIQQQPQQIIQYEPILQGTIYASRREAEGHIVNPNTKVLFIDKEKGMSYLKTANNDGQSFMRYFKNIEVRADGTPIEAEREENLIDYSNYVTKKELNEFVSLKQHNQLLLKVEQLQKMMEGKVNATATPKQST